MSFERLIVVEAEPVPIGEVSTENVAIARRLRSTGVEERIMHGRGDTEPERPDRGRRVVATGACRKGNQSGWLS